MSLGQKEGIYLLYPFETWFLEIFQRSPFLFCHLPSLVGNSLFHHVVEYFLKIRYEKGIKGINTISLSFYHKFKKLTFNNYHQPVTRSKQNVIIFNIQGVCIIEGPIMTSQIPPSPHYDKSHRETFIFSKVSRCDLSLGDRLKKITYREQLIIQKKYFNFLHYN